MVEFGKKDKEVNKGVPRHAQMTSNPAQNTPLDFYYVVDSQPGEPIPPVTRGNMKNNSDSIRIQRTCLYGWVNASRSEENSMKNIGSQKITATYVYWYELHYKLKTEEIFVLCNGVKDLQTFYDTRDLIINHLPNLDTLEDAVATGTMLTTEQPHTLCALKEEVLSGLELEQYGDEKWFYWDGTELFTVQAVWA